jgi:hypothetical protein
MSFHLNINHTALPTDFNVCACVHSHVDESTCMSVCTHTHTISKIELMIVSMFISPLKLGVTSLLLLHTIHRRPHKEAYQ